MREIYQGRTEDFLGQSKVLAKSVWSVSIEDRNKNSFSRTSMELMELLHSSLSICLTVPLMPIVSHQSSCVDAETFSFCISFPIVEKKVIDNILVEICKRTNYNKY
ncbi:unnamed protein product [Allacma fusca]|uniref:Uncharacterized protein n=1 Tax=Allacma fusca TaxID=39272 RepID=A0A8J2PKB7_9HEXA|nr:unnamed protein product [Allacma fusca]